MLIKALYVASCMYVHKIYLYLVWNAMQSAGTLVKTISFEHVVYFSNLTK